MDTRAKFEETAKDSKFFSFRISPNDFEKIIYHCPDCLSLPLIEINEDLLTANCQCDNNHSYTKTPIEELYQKLSETAFSALTLKTSKNIQCFKCKNFLQNENNEEDLSKILKNYGYCFKCKGALCYDCSKKPLSEDDEKKHDPKSHKLVPMDKFVTHCPIHRQKFSAYCLDCKENTCMVCGNEHRKHKRYHFDDYILLDDEVVKKKKAINELRTNCELLENKVNAILDKIRNTFHEEMKKQMNLIFMDELLLDAYQTNQFNYYYIENISKNLDNIQAIQQKVNDQDPKKLIVDLVNNCDISDLGGIEIKINQTEGELLQVSQPTKLAHGFKVTDYTKDTAKDCFNIENANASIKNEGTKLDMTTESKSNDDNANNKKVQTTFQSTEKKEDEKNQSHKSTMKEEKIQSHKSTIKEENNEDFSISNSFKNSKNNVTKKISCEFIGKNYGTQNYTLSNLPNTIEVPIEIRNTGNDDLPGGCYLFDENNCGSLMIIESNIDGLEVGKSLYRQLKFDTYIYSKGSYNLKLVVKNNKGVVISSNAVEFSLIVD